ncbi:MAG: MTH1187 family thiamine-binding protein [Cyanobacteria bacterium HKST-UBA04]|nr:MTH1187 family thiamine-binding protein [Cyanobacteria bacterium HKST-UBA04]
MPHVLVQVHLVPIGTGSTSVSRYVAAAEKVLRAQAERYGIKHQLHPMSSTLEGDLDAIYAVVRQMQEAMFVEGALRVSTSLRIDDRRDKPPRAMGSKVDSVNAKL